jgi:hypothetical protein
MRKTKYIYLCLMALFSIAAFANGFDEFGGGGYGNSNSGGYGNSGGGTYNGGTLGTVYIGSTQPGYVVPPPYTPPSYVPVPPIPSIFPNNGPGGYYYGSGPTGTGTSTGTTPTNETNLINKPVLTKAELDQLIKELKGAVTVKVYAYVDSQGNTRIGELTTITNPNVPSHHLLYFDELGGPTNQVRLPDNQNGTIFDSNTTNINSNYTVAPWDGNTTQPNPNSVWIQEPNNGTWLLITPNYPTTVVSVPHAEDPSKAGGISKDDAKQLQNNILNVLNKSPKFDKFKVLLKRGLKDNKAFFSKIPQDKLDEALKDLDTEDQKVFATIVANTINSDKPMTIQYFTTDTLLKTANGVVSSDYNMILNLFKLHPSLETALISSGGGLTSKELLFVWGSGATIANNGGTASFLDTTSPFYNEVTALHEFFGHGRPKSIETASTKHNQEDAILFENLVWRLLGKPEKQRNGNDHGNEPRRIIPNYTTALPSFR